MTRHELLVGCLAALAVAFTVPCSPAGAQGYPFSQRGSVTQNVALTKIAISYGRPVARGRELFGKLVPWDSVWHPGADSATRISFSHDVLLEGRPVAAGEYSVWLIPREKSAWTLVLSHRAHVFHTPYPGAGFDALRVNIPVVTGEHIESLGFYFSMVIREEAVLRLHWGTTILPIRISAPYRPEIP
ncbi:MAG: DUF2911 domain-containing protein [Gemmatimonadaceae bacterium]